MKAALVLWAAPWSCVGLLLGLAGLATGGGVQWRRSALEFHGGAVRGFLNRVPNGEFIVAMTLGHTILGKNVAALDVARDHEHVHIRQYERWGPLFGPAYLLGSLCAWLRGRDPYRDNPFERQAYDETG